MTKQHEALQAQIAAGGGGSGGGDGGSAISEASEKELLKLRSQLHEERSNVQFAQNLLEKVRGCDLFAAYLHYFDVRFSMRCLPSLGP